ncbi:uncharacterized protein N7482_009473 [Penicillium canariense]|uniref:UBC core domain-containing protein n=1 Tax=Penicillium canariense TaxID=189055 RepID=A0A9W9HQX0_9EURO|nr:uncharacterized protein N7482_009473 [Penicillium canariense]KAJ5152995.1 hypothetical protein N7482_009473 [Penicillium canariense]
MPTKDFQRDLNQATTPGRFSQITGVRAGEGDGSISFTFTEPRAGASFGFEAIVHVADPHDYPSSHTFFVYSTSEDVPAEITQAVDDTVPQFDGLSIHDFLSTLERVVSAAVQGSSAPSSDEMIDDLATSSDQGFIDDYEPSDWTEDEDTFFAITKAPAIVREKIRSDLRAVKHAGFKVGYHGDPAGSVFVSLAIRIAKLGLSEEAMSAWNVRPTEYLVLLIRYTRYQTMEELNNGGDSMIQLRVGLCDSYKPSFRSTVKAFQDTVLPKKQSAEAAEQDPGPLLRGLFIGAPLEKLLNERFLGIARLRLKYGFSWTAAELFFHTSQGKVLSPHDAHSEEFMVEDTWVTPAPDFLRTDHMADAGLCLPKISFPLLAMLFLMRHFIKCTEFCLVCHCKTYDSFEALKPYVCSNGLCLFQYITFGMGPSLEYEIRSQPYVVDMLVSLAYARAKSGRLVDFPTGLGLNVPDTLVPDSDTAVRVGPNPPSSNQVHTVRTPPHAYEATLITTRMELSHAFVPQVNVGNWIVILNPEKPVIAENKTAWHCRVQHIGETSGFVSLSCPLSQGRQLSDAEIIDKYPASREVQYVIYDKNFDDLDPDKKRKSITMLLGTLPSVDSMVAFLGHHGSGKLLSSWQDVVAPAALDLLRWVVASNRSCILQDSSESKDLVSGMKGFIQFRLVQGAPDKEQRFMEAVNQHAMHTKSAYPTIFAWHGSPLHNWHSILREGLHFNEVAHGRAYGHGVYLSNHYGISAGYGSHGWGQSWPQSKLNITSMISLNEIVNHAAKFVSISPHYVVQHLDWIQPRYLFVQIGKESTVDAKCEETAPSVIYQQDPKHLVQGPNGKSIHIPISAFSSKRRQSLESAPAKVQNKTKTKKKRGPRGSPIDVDSFDDAASISTDIEDLDILLSESEKEPDGVISNKKKKGSDKKVPKTDFIPGTLHEQSLRLLSPPTFATSTATKLLQRHLQATLKVQASEPLHELGWYVDPNLIKTVYQWIVELHTFDPTLPLAKDLKAAKLASVILEIRFPPQFPMDPPFVRVIRPRFMEFARGGGGHVTAGGAMCLELLTNSGWSAVTSMESLLLQVRMALSATDPHPGRLSHERVGDYSVGEAVQAYTRACMAHGWVIPKDMKAMSW